MQAAYTEGAYPWHTEQSAYVLYLIRKKNHLADNLNSAWFLLWFYLLSDIEQPYPGEI